MELYEQYIALKDKLNLWSYEYYVLDNPSSSDYEYDMALRELEKLENAHPELISSDSPTQRVGGKAISEFQEVTHEVALQSLQDVFEESELEAFDNRVHEAMNSPEYIVEPKVDGLSVALEYVDGIFIRGATRGDGNIGEDVTENIKTIHSVPLKLENAPHRIIVRGECYISRDNFIKLNDERELNEEKLFANARNAAAGSLRQLDPKIAAKRRLDCVIFNIQLIEDNTLQPFANDSESLDYLSNLKFRVIPYKKCTKLDEVKSWISELGDNRERYAYDIDGAVVKLNNLSVREQLGSTIKFPRWAVAWKYPPEQKPTMIRDIVIQVGRTGVLTPKAVVNPVRLAGTTVTNATLHNQDFITEKDIRIGDTVTIQKAGEIIPQIVSVDFSKRPNDSQAYYLPNRCPVCGANVERDFDGAAYRCTGAECPAQLVRHIEHFASREAMDIEGLGQSIVELLISNNLVKSPADLYKLKSEDVASLERMGKKSANNLIKAINKSKSNDLSKLICAFGIRQVGNKAAKILAQEFGDLDSLMNADIERLTSIQDIGAITADCITKWFQSEQSQHLIESLRADGVNFKAEITKVSDKLSGLTFVITGTLPNLSRNEATKIIEDNGGKVSGSVSKKTSYLVAGEEAGSKLTKAQSLNIQIIGEADLLSMVK